jgi:transketolase
VTTTSTQGVDELCINTIRTLAVDAVQAADSGHPGTPMAMAPVVYTLWQQFLRFDPTDPIWPNRDGYLGWPGHMLSSWRRRRMSSNEATKDGRRSG